MKAGVVLSIVAVVGLTGCAPTVEVSTPNSVLIGGVSKWGGTEALRLAEKECAKYGKHAVPIPDDTPDWQKAYECKS